MRCQMFNPTSKKMLSSSFGNIGTGTFLRYGLQTYRIKCGASGRQKLSGNSTLIFILHLTISRNIRYSGRENVCLPPVVTSTQPEHIVRFLETSRWRDIVNLEASAIDSPVGNGNNVKVIIRHGSMESDQYKN